MRLVSLQFVAVALSLGVGSAVAGTSDRVLLADPDPQLARAVETSLSPWSIPIVVAEAVPFDVDSARTQATAEGATYVVWRDSGELVIFDRSRDSVERRPAAMGPMDPVGATSVALTLKTLMRLPAETPAPSAPAVGTTTAAAASITRELELPPSGGGPRLRFDGGVGVRLAPGSDGGASTRAALGATLRPWPELGLGFGVRGDVGSAWSVDSAGFTGRWRDWSAIATTSWTFDRGMFEIEPWVGAGLGRGTLSGDQRGTARSEHQTGLALRAGCAWTAKLAMLRFGAALELGASPSARTFRSPEGTQVFAAPSFGVQVGLVVGGELSP
ncbi:MAG: hypothetical protein JNL83_18320 [Myxococcales bacterium]|nr:hypothetical protein [Myxococcales bacterium]